MIELKEQLQDAKREAERERERMLEKLNAQEAVLKTLEFGDALLSENADLRKQTDVLRTENAALEEQLQALQTENEGLRQQLHETEVQLSELGKLSAGVAKKSSQDDVSKALRIYLNTSKRKTLSKREAAKTVFLELIAAAKLTLPEDIMDLLSHFDDEQPEPQIVIERAADVIACGGVKNVKEVAL